MAIRVVSYHVLRNEGEHGKHHNHCPFVCWGPVQGVFRIDGFSEVVLNSPNWIFRQRTRRQGRIRRCSRVAFHTLITADEHTLSRTITAFVMGVPVHIFLR